MNDYELSYSYYDDDEEELDNLQLNYDTNDLHNTCVLPTLRGIGPHIMIIILCNMAFRIATQIAFIHINLCNCLSIIFGITVIYAIMELNISYIVIFCLVSYLAVNLSKYILKRFYAPFTAALGISFLVVCELLLNGVTWHHIRCVYMILVMKIVSLAFDLEIGRINTMPDILSYCGYLICPSNSIFGPWIPYKQYLSIFHRPIWDWILIPKVLIKAMISLFFLLLSSCWTIYLIPDGSWKWLEAYRDALSFRTSNYFISYLAETAMITGGYSQNYKLFYGSISNPIHIELPRSLIQVVIHWNIPMHMWLKTYIFRETRRYGVFAAICLTYIISSLLHGLNFKLAAVLLSIGIYSYIEFRLRNKLSNIFSACINVNNCSNCHHSYQSKNIYVIIGNLCFSFIAIVHLAYLGMVFDSNESVDSDSGYDYRYTLNKWGTLDYTSHWIAAVFYVSYLLV